jgi:hypothetical protein
MAGLNEGNCPADCLMRFAARTEPTRAPGVVWAVIVDKALHPADRQSFVRVTGTVDGLAPSFGTGSSMEPRASFRPG